MYFHKDKRNRAKQYLHKEKRDRTAQNYHSMHRGPTLCGGVLVCRFVGL